MSDVESVKTKVEKLFKKAESAKELGSLQEAEAFMAKAQEILLKHNIEKSQLNLSDEEESPVEYLRFSLDEHFNFIKTEGQWLISLLNVVARNNFCKVVKNGNTHATIIGEQDNMDVVLYMVANIVPKIRGLEKQRWKEYNGFDKRGAFRRGYLAGAVHGIHLKLQEQRKKDTDKYEGLTGIVVLKDQLVDEKMAEIFGKLRTSRTRRLSSSSGAAQGQADGKNLKLNKGLSGKKSNNTKYLN